MGKTIEYGKVEIYVNDEVAEFLEQDERSMESQKRSDRRHVSKSDFEEVVTTTSNAFADPVFEIVSRKLTLEKLQNAIETLSDDEQKLIILYFYENKSMETIGEVFGISKMAISKRLKKLLSKMRNLMET